MADVDRRGRRRWPRVAGWLVAGLLGLVLAASWWAGPAYPEPRWVPPPEPPRAEMTGPLDLEASPLDAPVDQPVSIRVRGLSPSEVVTLRATTEDANGHAFTSWARFRADSTGVVDAARSEPLDGTYRSADASGLLWSMRSGDRAFVTSRGWSHREVTLTAEAGGRGATLALTRRYPWADVVPTALEGSGFRGELWLPDREAPAPGVVLLSGYGDGFSPMRAALLASRGYAVLDVWYHGLGGGPTPELIEVPIETVTGAVDVLAGHPRVAGDRIGVFGTSKGAELALVAASIDPRIKAVAAWVPASVVFAGISFRDLTPSSSWSHEGAPLPFARATPGFDEVRNMLRMIFRRPVSFTESYRKAVERAPESARIPVERVSGPILVAGAGDDRLWPSALMVEQIRTRWEERDPPWPLTALVFPEAGHGLTLALWPSATRTPSFFDRGGTMEADHAAGREAWAATVRLFEEALSPDAYSGVPAETDLTPPGESS